MDRQMDGRMDRWTDRETNGERERQTERERDRQRDREAERQRGRQTERQTDREADRQTNRQTDTDRQTTIKNTPTLTFCNESDSFDVSKYLIARWSSSLNFSAAYPTIAVRKSSTRLFMFTIVSHNSCNSSHHFQLNIGMPVLCKT